MTTVSLQELENLINEWLLTLDNDDYSWDGVECSDRSLARTFVIDGLPFDDSFLQWLEKK